jgi:hypothetical protein
MRPILRTLLMSVSVVVAGATIGLATNQAQAAGPNSDEIWFGDGPDSLELDDEGKLTDAGAKSRITELDQIPGEEDWEVKLHARMGKFAAEGPLYVEFYQNIEGHGENIVFRHEDADYDGSRLYTTVIMLEGNIGFNKNREYRVQIVQNNGTKDIVMARGKIKLIDTGREAEGEGEEEGEEAEEDGEEAEEEAEDEEEEDDGEDEAADSGAPPEIEETPETKKGCSVVSGGALDLGFGGVSGLAILLLAGATARRRRQG